MMKNYLILILLLNAYSTFAQNHIIGIVAGKSWMNVNAKEDYFNEANGRIELTYGLSYENRLKQNLMIGADLMYYQKGFSLDVLIIDIDGEYSGYKLEDVVRNDFDYFALPLKCGYVIGNKIEGFVNAGLIPSILINANTYFPESQLYGHNWISNTPYDIKDKVSKIDLAGLVEIGTNIKLTSRVLLSASFSYQHSITTLSNSDYYEGMRMRHNGVVLTGGLKYALLSE